MTSSEKARKVLGWKPQYADLETIIFNSMEMACKSSGRILGGIT